MTNRWVGCLILGTALAISLAPIAAQATAAENAAAKAEAAAEHAGHGSGELNPLDFQRDTALWTGVVFVVLLAVLWKFAWGPIAEGLMRRERGIADQIEQAHQTNEKARQLLDEYHQRLAAAQDEVRGILERASQDADKLGREMIAKAKAETEAEKQRGLREIDAATAGALKELAEKSAGLAVELAGKILQAKLNPADHARLIERAMADFDQSRRN